MLDICWQKYSQVTKLFFLIRTDLEFILSWEKKSECLKSLWEYVKAHFYTPIWPFFANRVTLVKLFCFLLLGINCQDSIKSRLTLLDTVSLEQALCWDWYKGNQQFFVEEFFGKNLIYSFC